MTFESVAEMISMPKMNNTNASISALSGGALVYHAYVASYKSKTFCKVRKQSQWKTLFIISLMVVLFPALVKN